MLYYQRLIVTCVLLCVGLVTVKSELKISSSDTITLDLYESGQLPSGIIVQIDSIYDNRCPKNVQCNRAGRAKVRVVLSQDRINKLVDLILLAGQESRTVQAIVGATTYQVTLHNVQSYGTGSTKAPTATVQVIQM